MNSFIMTDAFRRISYAGIVLLWFATMSVLVVRHYGHGKISETSQNSVIMPGELFQEHWMGVYHEGEKIGYSSCKTEKMTEGYIISEMLNMRLVVMGSERMIETTTKAYLDPDLRLRSFDLQIRSDVIMKISGRVDGKKLRMMIDTADSRSEQTLLLKDAPFLNLSLPPAIMKNGLVSGKKFGVMLLDPSTLAQEQVIFEVMDKDKLISMGETREAFKIRGNLKGMEFFVWLTEKGEILREESPIGYTL